MFGYTITKILCTLIGCLYPGYKSYQAVITKNVPEYMRWMMYWTVFSFFLVSETVLDMFVYWLPFYYELKLIFVIALVMPQFKFPNYIFTSFLRPQLESNSESIDALAIKFKVVSAHLTGSLGTAVKNMVVDAVMKGKSMAAGDTAAAASSSSSSTVGSSTSAGSAAGVSRKSTKKKKARKASDGPLASEPIISEQPLGQLPTYEETIGDDKIFQDDPTREAWTDSIEINDTHARRRNTRSQSKQDKPSA